MRPLEPGSRKAPINFAAANRGTDRVCLAPSPSVEQVSRFWQIRKSLPSSGGPEAPLRLVCTAFYSLGRIDRNDPFPERIGFLGRASGRSGSRFRLAQKTF